MRSQVRVCKTCAAGWVGLGSKVAQDSQHGTSNQEHVGKVTRHERERSQPSCQVGACRPRGMQARPWGLPRTAPPHRRLPSAAVSICRAAGWGMRERAATSPTPTCPPLSSQTRAAPMYSPTVSCRPHATCGAGGTAHQHTGRGVARCCRRRLRRRPGDEQQRRISTLWAAQGGRRRSSMADHAPAHRAPLPPSPPHIQARSCDHSPPGSRRCAGIGAAQT